MRASSYFCFKSRLAAALAGSYTGTKGALTLPCKETTMPTPSSPRRWLRKFWGAVCVIAGLVSIAAGLESVILE